MKLIMRFLQKQIFFFFFLILWSTDRYWWRVKRKKRQRNDEQWNSNTHIIMKVGYKNMKEQGNILFWWLSILMNTYGNNGVPSKIWSTTILINLTERKENNWIEKSRVEKTRKEKKRRKIEKSKRDKWRFRISFWNFRWKLKSDQF